jgi:uncharacterized protein (DUF58 family)
VARPLLTPELLRQLEALQLTAVRRARASLRGERRSRARGQSVEFADYRNYTPGDDFRYLDWNLYGRLERLYLKLYEEERELPVRIFLDSSESMTFGDPPKFQCALQIAAAVGYVALCGFDRVSVVSFPSVRPELSPGEQTARAGLKIVRGKRSGLDFLRNVSALTAAGEANLNESLRRGALETRHTGLAVVVSDFLDPGGYEQGLGALVNRGWQVDALQVLSSDEVSPAAFGDLRLVDSETGAVQEVTFGRFRAGAYRRAVEGFISGLRGFCRLRGIGFAQATSDANMRDLLLKQLPRAGVWR